MNMVVGMKVFLTVQMPYGKHKSPSERGVIVTFKFGSTEIRVDAKDKDSGKVCDTEFSFFRGDWAKQ